MIDGDLVRMFWDRTPERVGEATDLWLELEHGNGGQATELRRLFHTMKGEAHMLGLLDCARLMQILESVVERSKDGVPDGAGDVVLTALDALSMLAASEGANDAVDLDAIYEQLEASLDAPVTRTSADESGETPSRPVEEPTHTTAVEPATTSLDTAAVHTLVREARRLQREQALLRPALREVHRMLRALIAEIDPNLPPHMLAERIVKTLGYGADIERRVADLGTQWSTREFALETALEQLEEMVRSAAMVSVGGLSSQIHRSARAAAQSLGKHVHVSVRGDAYVDATVERSLGPALLHLVRNAVDHGVEPPEERLAHDKPAEGRIEVQIQQTESSVRVVVTDDGRGIDLDRLRARIDEIDPEGAPTDDAELIQRIFDHGVTTRTEVTDISGRGVGLDVVARQVHVLGGSVRVESTWLEGTRFEMVLPTMLRADVVVPVEARGVRMALPARVVVEVERLSEVVETPDGYKLRRGEVGRGELIPIVDLGALLGEPEAPRAGDSVAIVQHRAGLFAVRVDDYNNPRAMSFERTEQLAFDSDVVRGVAPAPDGGIYYLLDAGELFLALTGSHGGARASTRRSRRAVPHVLVVEDAPVARELLLGILRSFGLRVSDASDGKEGLARARSEKPDLIISDIEMPFLGGLEMIGELRTDPVLADTPVIVLTTRDDDEIRSRAAALGVRSFLSKQRFVEADLRSVIDECLSR